MNRITRRDFFRTGAMIALGATTVACGRDSRPAATAGSIRAIINGRPTKLQVMAVGTELLSGGPEVLTFALSDENSDRLDATTRVRMWIAADESSPALGPFDAVYHGEGLPEGRGVWEAGVEFPKNGNWLALVEAGEGNSALVGGKDVLVGPQTRMPRPGEEAISVGTPTTADTRGVDPICTRLPPCSMHAISLADAIKNGRPTVLVLASPAFCASALCGPEVDLVQAVSKEFASRANFVHIEVYRDDEPDTIQQQILSPAASAWRLEQEPAIYTIDAAGVIRGRRIGPVDRAAVRTLVSELF